MYETDLGKLVLLRCHVPSFLPLIQTVFASDLNDIEIEHYTLDEFVQVGNVGALADPFATQTCVGVHDAAMRHADICERN